MLFALVISVLVFIAGIQLVLSVQPNNLVDKVFDYFQYNFYIESAYEILNLSLFKRVAEDVMNLAGPNAESLRTGFFIVIAFVLLLHVFAFKGGEILINYFNKRKLKDQNTRVGFVTLIRKILIGMLFSALLTILLSLSAWSSLVCLLIYLVLESIEIVISVNYVFFKERSLNEIFKDKNSHKIILIYSLTTFSIITVSIALWFISPIIAIFVAVPLLAYNSTNVQYSMVEYYKENK